MIKHKKAAGRLVKITWNYWFRKKTRVNYAPYRLWVEPTNRCNLKCTMCPNKDFDKDELGNMDIDLYRSVIDACSGFVHDVNLHHRGEPTLHPRLAEMISYASERGVKTKLHTNGSTLTEKLSKQLLDSGLRLISFSFDGFTAGVYEKIRVGSNFEKTLNNIHRFLEMKKASGKQEPRTALEVIDFDPDNASTSNRNKEKEHFVRGLKSRGLDRLIIKPPHNWAGSFETGDNGKAVFSACTFPWHALVVLWDGRVGSCPHDFFAKTIYGDVKQNSMREIFNSDTIIRLRKQMLSGSSDNLTTPCDACDSIRRKRVMGIPLDSLKYLRD